MIYNSLIAKIHHSKSIVHERNNTISQKKQLHHLHRWPPSPFPMGKKYLQFCTQNKCVASQTIYSTWPLFSLYCSTYWQDCCLVIFIICGHFVYVCTTYYTACMFACCHLVWEKDIQLYLMAHVIFWINYAVRYTNRITYNFVFALFTECFVSSAIYPLNLHEIFFSHRQNVD